MCIFVKCYHHYIYAYNRQGYLCEMFTLLYLYQQQTRHLSAKGSLCSIYTYNSRGIYLWKVYSAISILTTDEGYLCERFTLIYLYQQQTRHISMKGLPCYIYTYNRRGIFLWKVYSATSTPTADEASLCQRFTLLYLYQQQKRYNSVKGIPQSSTAKKRTEKNSKRLWYYLASIFVKQMKLYM